MAKKAKTPNAKREKIKENEAKQSIQDVVKLQQLDGKLYNKRGVKSIDELLGEQVFKYSTTDPKEYEAQINRMNTSDLQTHAVKMGVLPKEDRRILIKTLLKQFNISVGGLNAVAQQPVSQKPITQETLDILAEGR